VTENELLEYNDALVGFASIVQQYGMQQVLVDFQASYPHFFKQLQQTTPKFPDKPVAALLRK
jgi:hypothetical protein